MRFGVLIAGDVLPNGATVLESWRIESSDAAARFVVVCVWPWGIDAARYAVWDVVHRPGGAPECYHGAYRARLSDAAKVAERRVRVG